jgi:hypothetical protein
MAFIYNLTFDAFDRPSLACFWSAVAGAAGVDALAPFDLPSRRR